MKETGPKHVRKARRGKATDWLAVGGSRSESLSTVHAHGDVMAVPSRAYVGILTFALLASLAVVPYTILILVGYEAPPEAPHELLFPEPQESDPGTKVVLVLASLFCLALVFVSWRGLLAVARRDAQVRKDAQASKQDRPKAEGHAVQPTLASPSLAGPPIEEEPPGYQ